MHQAGGLDRVSLSTRLKVVAALLAGGALWWALRRAQPQDVRTQQDDIHHWAALAFAAIVAIVPSSRHAVCRAVERLRHASPQAVRWSTAGVFVAITCYLGITATWQGRDLFPQWHDQQMTLVQAQLLAHGRLWLPQHPCADFFETFYILVKPVYAPIYFPGAALFYVPTVWLHLPFWLQPVLASGALAALLFGVISELIDPAAGILAAVFLAALWIFRLLSLWEMSHTIFALLSLWAVWSWLRWRQSHRVWWAVSLGAAMGWAAITRPLDAVAYAIPLAIALLWDYRSITWRKRITTSILIIVPALPFLSLQLILDRGITGHFFETPFQYYYTDVEFTGLSPNGIMPAPDAHPTSKLPQKQLFGNLFVLPTERKYASETFPTRLRDRSEEAAIALLPSAVLLVLLPAGLLALGGLGRWVLFLTVVLFLAFYAFYPLWLNHYSLAIAPGVMLLVLLGSRVVIGAFPGAPKLTSAFLNLSILGLLVTSLPEFHPSFWDETNDWPAVSFNYESLPQDVNAPALVLYRYWKLPPPGESHSVEESVRNFNDEPVYNVDSAWIDESPIIRAHDLGARDALIIEYYGRIQPQRNVYLVDRTDLKIHVLGRAGDLSRRLQTGESISQIIPPK